MASARGAAPYGSAPSDASPGQHVPELTAQPGHDIGRAITVSSSAPTPAVVPVPRPPPRKLPDRLSAAARDRMAAPSTDPADILSADCLLLCCDERDVCALACVCKALRAACAADWVWENAASACWPALAHSAVQVPQPGGQFRELFRRRALLPGWRSVCPLLDGSLQTVRGRAVGWPALLASQLLRLLGLSRGLSDGGRSDPLSRRSEHEEARRWRAAMLAALLSPSDALGGRVSSPALSGPPPPLASLQPSSSSARPPPSACAEASLPPRLLELRVWSLGLAAELDSFYNGIGDEFVPHTWLSRISSVLRGRSALQLLCELIIDSPHPIMDPHPDRQPAPAAPGGQTGGAAAGDPVLDGSCASRPGVALVSPGGGGDTGGDVCDTLESLHLLASAQGVAPGEGGGRGEAREVWEACGVRQAIDAIDSSLESLLLEGFNVSVPATWRPAGVPRSHGWWWCPPPIGRHAQGC